MRAMIGENTPTNGLWFEAIQLLKMCYEAFIEAAFSITESVC
jgi:hypothetical protein